MFSLDILKEVVAPPSSNNPNLQATTLDEPVWHTLV
jgi:hypothetical protein